MLPTARGKWLIHFLFSAGASGCFLQGDGDIATVSHMDLSPGSVLSGEI